jgi:hypothetical protein
MDTHKSLALKSEKAIADQEKFYKKAINEELNSDSDDLMDHMECPLKCGETLTEFGQAAQLKHLQTCAKALIICQLCKESIQRD